MAQRQPYKLPLWAHTDLDLRAALDTSTETGERYLHVREELIRRGLLDGDAASEHQRSGYLPARRTPLT